MTEPAVTDPPVAADPAPEPAPEPARAEGPRGVGRTPRAGAALVERARSLPFVAVVALASVATLLALALCYALLDGQPYGLVRTDGPQEQGPIPDDVPVTAPPLGPGTDPLLRMAEARADDFDRAVAEGLGEGEEVGEWEVVEPGFVVDGSRARPTTPRSVALLPDEDQPRAVEVRVRAAAISGLVVGWRGPSDHWVARTDPSLAAVVLERVGPEGPEIVATSGLVDVLRPVTVGVRVQDGAVSLLVDGRVVDTAEAEVPPGRVGVLAGLSAVEAPDGLDSFAYLPG